MSNPIDQLLKNMMETAISKMDKANIAKPGPEVMQAFYKVPRHLFVPYLYDEEGDKLKKVALNYADPDLSFLEKVYVDTPLAIWAKDNEVLSTSSQPLVMAVMLRDARVKAGDKVLEIGTGCGYNAGVTATIVGNPEKVVTIEIYPEVAELAAQNLNRAGFPGVEVITGDGGRGYPKKAPYNCIIITCGSPEIPWSKQLADDGTISLPLVTRGVETLCSLTKQPDGSFKGYLSLFVRFLHFEGIYSDQRHFSREIGALKRMIEGGGHKNPEVTSALSTILLSGAESESEALAKRKERSAFELFLAVSDKDAMVYLSDVKGRERGYAIWRREKQINDSGVAVMFPNEVIHWGNPKIAGEIGDRYREWVSLGKPSLADYEVRFYPTGLECPSLSGHSYEVKRKSGSTVFSLKNK